MEKKKSEKTNQNAVYQKKEIVSSKKFRNRKDLLNAVLDEDKAYTMEEVKKVIEKFMKGKVN